MMVCKLELHCKLCDSSCPHYIEVEPVKHGHWINRGDNSWECSECHEISCCTGNYCVDCGAKMDGERKDDEHTD